MAGFYVTKRVRKGVVTHFDVADCIGGMVSIHKSFAVEDGDEAFANAQAAAEANRRNLAAPKRMADDDGIRMML